MASASRAVQVGWLCEMRREVPREWTTADVVESIVKPRTLAAQCRFVELPEMRDGMRVGEAAAFASHTWGALFHELVATLAHVFESTQFVWLDIFAVCQHPGEKQQADLQEFVPLITHARTLVLCVSHLPSLVEMDRGEVVAQSSHLLPLDERKKCAFFRVWCLLELAAAAACSATVMMLVGSADEDFAFVPNDETLDDLYHLIDVRNADATFESDKALIFDTLLPQTMGLDPATSIARVNRLGRGAINGAEILLLEQTYVGEVMRPDERRAASRAVMQAAIGNFDPLSNLTKQGKAHALTGAAAAGFLEPLKYLLDAGAPIEQPDASRGRTPLMLASNGGHEKVVRELIKRGADVNRIVAEGNVGDNALPLAAEGGHPSVLRLLIDTGADLARYGPGAITLAAVDGHVDAIQVLLEAGVKPDERAASGEFALSMAATGGHLKAVKFLLDAGAGSAAAQQALAWTDAARYPEIVGLLRNRV